MVAGRAFGGWGRDLAIDLGTANTLVHVRGRGVVVDQPSLVAVAEHTGRLIATGTDAEAMLGRTPTGVLTIRPLADGVITDADIAEQMLRHFMSRVKVSRLVRPRMVVCVPSDATAVERRALEDAALHAGARRVYVLEEAMAAAIGAGLPVHDARASLVVDIGGGTTDVAMISLGGVVNSRSIRSGGREVEEAIIAALRRDHDLLVGERTAAEITHTIASAYPLATERELRVRGRRIDSGLPATITLTSGAVRSMIDPPVRATLEVIRAVLDIAPPELSGDLLEHGVVLTGGGAQLLGLPERLRGELGVPVRLADDPLRAVIRGAGACIDDLSALERVVVSSR